jgi:hypothetical protein
MSFPKKQPQSLDFLKIVLRTKKTAFSVSNQAKRTPTDPNVSQHLIQLINSLEFRLLSPSAGVGAGKAACPQHAEFYLDPGAPNQIW